MACRFLPPNWPIRDDEGRELGFGEDQVGEICIRGPQVMRGYWNRPEETAQVMTEDGYLRTGDVGYVNQRGYVRIVDRKKGHDPGIRLQRLP